jgi:hypothetical protein
MMRYLAAALTNWSFDRSESGSVAHGTLIPQVNFELQVLVFHRVNLRNKRSASQLWHLAGLHAEAPSFACGMEMGAAVGLSLFGATYISYNYQSTIRIGSIVPKGLSIERVDTNRSRL